MYQLNWLVFGLMGQKVEWHWLKPWLKQSLKTQLTTLVYDNDISGQEKIEKIVTEIYRVVQK